MPAARENPIQVDEDAALHRTKRPPAHNAMLVIKLVKRTIPNVHLESSQTDSHAFIGKSSAGKYRLASRLILPRSPPRVARVVAAHE
jgi:hypothetical protein